MEVDQEQDKDSDDILVYMEFDDRSEEHIFDKEIFFRMTTFKGSPLIQLNKHIYRGEYKSYLGTNLFFSDCKDSQSDSVFDFGSYIRLKHQATQYKVLELKPVKIPSDMKKLPKPLHDIKINKDYDYQSLLKKFADGTLNMKEDLVVVPREDTDDINSIHKQHDEKNQEIQSVQSTTVESTPKLLPNEESLTRKNVEKQLNVDESVPPSKEENKDEVVNIISYKLDKLRRLAMRPTRRKIEPESIAECEEKYKKAYSYNSLKCTVMKPSDYFRVISEEFNEKTLVGAVDIDRSVIQGVINKSSDFYRILSEDEKLALLSIRNFENLSMSARYMVIKSHLEHLESTLPTLCRDEIFERDTHGRTVTENIKLYKRLLRVLGGLVKQQYAYDSDAD